MSLIEQINEFLNERLTPRQISQRLQIPQSRVDLVIRQNHLPWKSKPKPVVIPHLDRNEVLSDLVSFGRRYLPKVNIVIGCWNALKYVKMCLKGIEENTVYPNYRVIIVNDASTEKGLKEYLDSLPSKYKVVHNKKNLGYGQALNVGMRKTRGKYVLFLNVDTIPQVGWLWELVKVAENDKKVGVVGAKLLYPNGTIQHAGCYFPLCGGWKPALGYKGKMADAFPLAGHIYGGKPADYPPANVMKELQAVTGACQLFRAKPLKKVGGHDPNFLSMDYEDMDLCFAVRHLGYKCIYNPRSVLIHFTSKLKLKNKKYADSCRTMEEYKGRMVTHNIKLLLSKWEDEIVVDA